MAVGTIVPRRMRQACGFAFIGLSLSAGAGITAQDTDLTFTSLTAGAVHTCAITMTGAAYCWGSNYAGQLGNESPEPPGSSSTPVPVAGDITFVSLSAGAIHTCGLTEGGTAYCWGSNSRGKLGNGTTLNSSAPVPVAGELNFRQLSAGAGYTCGIAVDGAAYCWGDNSWGQLGDGSAIDVRQQPVLSFFDREANERTDPRFTSRPSAVAGALTFASLSAAFVCFLDPGEEGVHSCGRSTHGVTPEGEVYWWGSGDNPSNHTTTPLLIDGTGPTGLHFESVATGGGHIFCGVTAGGSASCLGWASGRVLDETPVAISGELNFTSLSAGGLHTCGVATGGAAYCWGGPDGLGDGRDADSAMPTNAPVPVSGGLTFQSLSTGSNHTCGVTTDGAVYCWGLNMMGQLGNGRRGDPGSAAFRSAVPVRVVSPR